MDSFEEGLRHVLAIFLDWKLWPSSSLKVQIFLSAFSSCQLHNGQLHWRSSVRHCLIGWQWQCVCALCAADGHGKALAIALMLMATAQLTEGDEHSQAGTQGSGQLSVRSVLGTRPSQSVS